MGPNAGIPVILMPFLMIQNSSALLHCLEVSARFGGSGRSLRRLRRFAATALNDAVITAGAPFNTPGPDNASFLVKLGTTGASEVYGTFLPGSATGLSLDNNASAHVVGLAPVNASAPACANTIPTTTGVVEPNFPSELCPLAAPPSCGPRGS